MRRKTQNASCVSFNIVQIKHCASFALLNLIQLTHCALLHYASIDQNRMRYLFCVLHNLKDIYSTSVICVLLNMRLATQKASCVYFNIVQKKHCASFAVFNLIQRTYYPYFVMHKLMKTEWPEAKS